MLFRKKVSHILMTSNIIQLDDMGYPLMLCIMSDGSQQWVDIGKEWAFQEVEKNNLRVIEWRKNENAGGIKNERNSEI